MQALDALLVRTEPKPLTNSQKAIVKLLKKVNSLEETIARKKWRLSGIGIHSGIIPAVELCLVPEDPTPAGDAEAAATPGDTPDEPDAVPAVEE